MFILFFSIGLFVFLPFFQVHFSRRVIPFEPVLIMATGMASGTLSKYTYYNMEDQNTTAVDQPATLNNILHGSLLDQIPQGSVDIAVGRMQIPLGEIPLTTRNIPFEQWAVAIGNSDVTGPLTAAYVPQFNAAVTTLSGVFQLDSILQTGGINQDGKTFSTDGLFQVNDPPGSRQLVTSNSLYFAICQQGSSSISFYKWPTDTTSPPTLDYVYQAKANIAQIAMSTPNPTSQISILIFTTIDSPSRLTANQLVQSVSTTWSSATNTALSANLLPIHSKDGTYAQAALLQQSSQWGLVCSRSNTSSTIDVFDVTPSTGTGAQLGTITISTALFTVPSPVNQTASDGNKVAFFIANYNVETDITMDLYAAVEDPLGSPYFENNVVNCALLQDNPAPFVWKENASVNNSNPVIWLDNITFQCGALGGNNPCSYITRPPSNPSPESGGGYLYEVCQPCLEGGAIACSPDSQVIWGFSPGQRASNQLCRINRIVFYGGNSSEELWEFYVSTLHQSPAAELYGIMNLQLEGLPTGYTAIDINDETNTLYPTLTLAFSSPYNSIIPNISREILTNAALLVDNFGTSYDLTITAPDGPGPGTSPTITSRQLPTTMVQVYQTLSTFRSGITLPPVPQFRIAMILQQMANTNSPTTRPVPFWFNPLCPVARVMPVGLTSGTRPSFLTCPALSVSQSHGGQLVGDVDIGLHFLDSFIPAASPIPSIGGIVSYTGGLWTNADGYNLGQIWANPLNPAAANCTASGNAYSVYVAEINTNPGLYNKIDDDVQLNYSVLSCMKIFQQVAQSYVWMDPNAGADADHRCAYNVGVFKSDCRFDITMRLNPAYTTMGQPNFTILRHFVVINTDDTVVPPGRFVELYYLYTKNGNPWNDWTVEILLGRLVWRCTGIQGPITGPLVDADFNQYAYINSYPEYDYLYGINHYYPTLSTFQYLSMVDICQITNYVTGIAQTYQSTMFIATCNWVDFTLNTPFYCIHSINSPSQDMRLIATPINIIGANYTPTKLPRFDKAMFVNNQSNGLSQYSIVWTRHMNPNAPAPTNYVYTAWWVMFENINRPSPYTGIMDSATRMVYLTEVNGDEGGCYMYCNIQGFVTPDLIARAMSQVGSYPTCLTKYQNTAAPFLSCVQDRKDTNLFWATNGTYSATVNKLVSVLNTSDPTPAWNTNRYGVQTIINNSPLVVNYLIASLAGPPLPPPPIDGRALFQVDCTDLTNPKLSYAPIFNGEGIDVDCMVNGGQGILYSDGGGNLYTSTINNPLAYTQIFFNDPSTTGFAHIYNFAHSHLTFAQDAGPFTITSYNQYVTQINTALQACYESFSTAHSSLMPSGTYAPFFSFDSATSTFSLNIDKQWYSSTAQKFKVFINSTLQKKLRLPPRVSTNAGTGMVTQNGIDYIEIDMSAGNLNLATIRSSQPISIQQEGTTIGSFNDLKLIYIQTTIPATGDVQGNTTINAITSISVDTDSLPVNSHLTYLPNGFYRIYNVKQMTQLHAIGVSIWYSTKQGEYLPLQIAPGSSWSIMLVFIRR